MRTRYSSLQFSLDGLDLTDTVLILSQAGSVWPLGPYSLMCSLLEVLADIFCVQYISLLLYNVGNCSILYSQVNVG